MKAREIQTKIWADSFFSDLSSNEKLLFIYYLTSPLITIIHLYECPDKLVVFDTGVNKDIITEAKKKFEKSGKIHFFKDWVYLYNASRYQRFTGEKNDIAKERLFQQLPKNVIDWYNNINDTPIHTPIHTLCNHNHIHNSNCKTAEIY